MPPLARGLTVAMARPLSPQRMGMAQKPPVKMFMFWSFNTVGFFFLGDLFDSLSCSTRSAAWPSINGPVSYRQLVRTDKPEQCMQTLK